MPVGDLRIGPFQTAVLTRWCGLASTPHDAGPHHSRAPVKDAGSLHKLDALQLARLALSDSQFEAAAGMAAINSLLNIDEDRCIEYNAGDLLVEKAEGQRVALVGRFPFVPDLRRAARTLWVLERNPIGDEYPESKADNLIPQADVVGITGMSFTNGTFPALLAACRREAYVVVLGGTTPLSPVLFDYGVDAVSGTRVVNVDTVLAAVSQGATFRQLKDVRRLIMKREGG